MVTTNHHQLTPQRTAAVAAHHAANDPSQTRTVGTATVGRANLGAGKLLGIAAPVPTSRGLCSVAAGISTLITATPGWEHDAEALHRKPCGTTLFRLCLHYLFA
jgi:hypothetical protein